MTQHPPVAVEVVAPPPKVAGLVVEEDLDTLHVSWAVSGAPGGAGRPTGTATGGNGSATSPYRSLQAHHPPARL